MSAFDCVNCPKKNQQEAVYGCPAWWEQPWREGPKEYIRKGCAFEMLPSMFEVLGATLQLSMSTAHEMNKRLDRTDNANVRLGAQMEGLAKAIYLAADAAQNKEQCHDAIADNALQIGREVLGSEGTSGQGEQLSFHFEYAEAGQQLATD